MNQDNAVAEALERLAALATPGPWAYRPEEFDDWGVVKSPPREVGNYEPPFILRGHIAQFHDPEVRDEEALNEHRRNKTDPWRWNAELIVALRNNLPTIIAALKAQRVDEGGVS